MSNNPTYSPLDVSFFCVHTRKTYCSCLAQRPTFGYQNSKSGCKAQSMIAMSCFIFPNVFLWCCLPFEVIAESCARRCWLNLPFISACDPEVITAFQGGFLAVMGGGGKIISVMHTHAHARAPVRMSCDWGLQAHTMRSVVPSVIRFIGLNRIADQIANQNTSAAAPPPPLVHHSINVDVS